MSQQQDISCGLEFAAAPDIKSCLTEALHNSYVFIVAPIVHPRFRRFHGPSGGKVAGFTRSDMLLSPEDWTVRIVGKLSPYLDVDSPSPVVRQRHEDCLTEELVYCRGLGLPAIMLKLHGRESNNLARIMHTYFKTSYQPSQVWMRLPMFSQRVLELCIKEGRKEEEEAWNETWLWWSLFHERMNWNKRVGVVLEISADLPNSEIIKRWLGEPVKAIIIPTSIFHNNKKGYPVLSRHHQQLVADFIEHEAQVIVSGARRSSVEYYVQYLYRLWQRSPHRANDPMQNFAKGWVDYLQTPLQPLADNLDTYTYNVFEKDPIKYDQYQKAIAQALTHLKVKKLNEKNIHKNITETNGGDGDKQVSESKIIVMVLGAGRGPLVRATLNAADLTHTPVKVIVVEKNPCAVVVLSAQAREVWRDRDVTVMAGDMRFIKLEHKADIIVSELLGSWGDNELSPECLDGAASLLKPDGISIPCAYTSHVAPVSSPRLWAAARDAAATSAATPDKNLETLWVVYMQNKHDIGDTKPVFKFEHPSSGALDQEGKEALDHRGLPMPDNRRCATITWTASQDNMLHGFGGYFDCLLFGDEMISIVPSTHSPGMISWFPVFIPIKTPLRVHEGEVISATFWRCVNPRRVWYEWIVQVGDRTTQLHNSNGRSSEMLL